MPRRRAKQPNPTVGGLAPPGRTASVPQVNLYPPVQGRKNSAKKSSPASRSLTATPHHKGLIWTVPDFLTPAECAAWLAYLSSSPFTTSQLRATAYTAFRHNGRQELWSAAVAEAIWNRLRPLLPTELSDGVPNGCYEKIRLYQYVVGQRFGKHIDEAVDVSDGVMTGATVLIYLNDEELEGGETVFYDGRKDENVVLSFRPKKGSLLVHGCVRNMCFLLRLLRHLRTEL